MSDCNSDPENSGLQCTKRLDNGDVGDSFFVKYQDSSNYVCFSPDDFSMFIDACRLNRKGK